MHRDRVSLSGCRRRANYALIVSSPDVTGLLKEPLSSQRSSSSMAWLLMASPRHQVTYANLFLTVGVRIVD
jgi:hypothetical protein